MSWKVLSIILYGHTLPNSILLTTEYLTALIARTDYMFCAGFFVPEKIFSLFFKIMQQITPCCTDMVRKEG